MILLALKRFLIGTSAMLRQITKFVQQAHFLRSNSNLLFLPFSTFALRSVFLASE